jgi:hypothetical protein
MIGIEIDAKQLKKLRDAVNRSGKKFAKEMAGAINAVSKKTKLQIGRDIRATVAMKKDEAEKPLSIRGTATAENLSATVTLRKTKRLGLRHFGAKQNKTGVSYKISKTGGRKRVDGAFQGPKPGVMKMSWKGNAFKRVGKERLPIIKLQGVSAFGAYAKNELSGPQVKVIEAELTKQMERRIKLNILRAEGLVAK